MDFAWKFRKMFVLCSRLLSTAKIVEYSTVFAVKRGYKELLFIVSAYPIDNLQEEAKG